VSSRGTDEVVVERRNASWFRQLKRWGTIVAAIAAALVSTVCGGTTETPSDQVEPGQTITVAALNGHTTGYVRVDGNSVVEGRNAFLVDFDPNQTALTQASALMPAHGHGSPATPTITRTQTGYRISDMIFSMPGLWNVLLDVDVAGVRDRVEFSVDVP
jgi:hypothetical protein